MAKLNNRKLVGWGVILLAFAIVIGLYAPTAEAVLFKIHGEGEVVTTTCTPPTTRENGVAITEAELDSTRVYWFPNSFTTDPAQAVVVLNGDIRCNTIQNVDNLPPGRYWVRADISDTDGRWSRISTDTREVLTVPRPSAPGIQ